MTGAAGVDVDVPEASTEFKPHVNAVVTLEIPLDGVGVDDDPKAKLEAAVAAFEASPAAEMPEATEIRFEDVFEEPSP